MADQITEARPGPRPSRLLQVPQRVGWVASRVPRGAAGAAAAGRAAARRAGARGVRGRSGRHPRRPLGASGRAVVNTLWTSVVVTVLATAGGTAAALVTERSRAPGRRWLRAALVASLVGAPLVSALGWVRAYGRSGVLDDTVGLHWAGLLGPAGIVVVGLGGRRSAGLPRRRRGAGEPRPSRTWSGPLAPRGAGPVAVVRTVTLPLARRPWAPRRRWSSCPRSTRSRCRPCSGIPAGFPTMTTRLYQDLTLRRDPAAFTDATVLAAALVVHRRAGRRRRPTSACSGLGSGRRTGMTAGAPSGRRAGRVVARGRAVGVRSPSRSRCRWWRCCSSRSPGAVGLAPVPANWTLANFDAALDPTFWSALGDHGPVGGRAPPRRSWCWVAIAAALGEPAPGEAARHRGHADLRGPRLGARRGRAARVRRPRPQRAGAHPGGLRREVLGARAPAPGRRRPSRLPADLLWAARAIGAGPGTVLRTVVAPVAPPGGGRRLAARVPLRRARADHLEPALRTGQRDPGRGGAQPPGARRRRGDLGAAVLLTLLVAAAGPLLLVARRAARQRALP